MHEYSIVQALYDKVLAEAVARGATSVSGLTVRLGALSGVDAGLLDTAWKTFRVRTLCEQAPLQIETVAAKWACSRCGMDVAPGGILTCPACEAPARLKQGDEIILARIEMEVGDV